MRENSKEANVDGMPKARERVRGNIFRDGYGKWILQRGGLEEWSYKILVLLWVRWDVTEEF